MSEGQGGDVHSRVITIAQASELLGISRDAVRKRIFRHTMPADKVDGQWWIRIDEFFEAVGDDYTVDEAVDVKFVVRDEEDVKPPPAKEGLEPLLRSEVARSEPEWGRLGVDVLLPAMQHFTEQSERYNREIGELVEANRRLEEENRELRNQLGEREEESDDRPWWKFW